MGKQADKKHCNRRIQIEEPGTPYPRTCKVCKFGSCPFYSMQPTDETKPSSEEVAVDFQAKAKAVLDGTTSFEIPPTLRIDDLAIACAAYRKSAYIGLREAARQIGMSATTLSRFENGKPIDLETMKGICRWLGVTQLVVGIPKEKTNG